MTRKSDYMQINLSEQKLIQMYLHKHASTLIENSLLSAHIWLFSHLQLSSNLLNVLELLPPPLSVPCKPNTQRNLTPGWSRLSLPHIFASCTKLLPEIRTTSTPTHNSPWRFFPDIVENKPSSMPDYSFPGCWFFSFCVLFAVFEQHITSSHS